MGGNKDNKIISFGIVAVLILVFVYVLIGQNNSGSTLVTDTNSETVSNESNGGMPVPQGFPQDIPVERSSIVDSKALEYKEENLKELSVSYESTESVQVKYSEYKTYLSQAGYTVTEGNPNSPVKSMTGLKPEANLAVVISSINGKTLVQLAYILKSLVD